MVAMTLCAMTDLSTDVCACCKPVASSVKEVEMLARQLMHEHGLTDWRFGWDRAKSRFGQCNYGTRTISLSKPWAEVRTLELSRDTILHEIAHALVGPRAGHGRVWQARARSIGCKGKRCGDSGGAQVATKYVGTCPKGHVTGRERSMKRVYACPKCSPRFDKNNIYVWTENGKPMKHSVAYLNELASLGLKLPA